MRNLMSKSKKVKKADLNLLAKHAGSHKVGDHQYAWEAGEEISVKAEHLEAMQSLPAFEGE